MNLIKYITRHLYPNLTGLCGAAFGWSNGRLASCLIACSLLTACHSEDTPKEVVTSAPIHFHRFDASTTPLGSRGTSRSDLSERYDNFLVLAVKTMPEGAQSTVMPEYSVRYHTDGYWYYEGIGGQYLKYWDESASSYTFTAVTPVPDSESTSPGFKNTTVTIGDEISISEVHGNLSTGDNTNSSGAPEWMVAKTERDHATLKDIDCLDATTVFDPLGAFTDEVPLMFHPTMAKVDFVAYAPVHLIVSSFKAEVIDGQKIVNRGDYNTTDGWISTWVDDDDYPLYFGRYDYLDGKTLSTDRDAPTMLASHVEIPQAWTGSRMFHVTVNTKSGEVYENDIEITPTINKGSDWKQGWHYTYVLYIKGTGSADVILVAVTMDLWYWKEGDSHSETQTNW